MSEDKGVLTDMSGAEEKVKISDAQLKAMKKQQEYEFLEYKKRLTKAVEIKRLQNEELELNINYYTLREKWLDIQPKVATLEEREAEMAAKAQEEQRKAEDAAKPKIVKPGGGKPRSETEKP